MRVVSLALVGVVSTALVVAPALADEPVDSSKRAAQQLDFTGVVRVQWRNGSRLRNDVLEVRSTDGVLSVGGAGAVPVVAKADQRYVGGPGVGWNLVWSGAAGASAPHTTAKYDLAYRSGPELVGRPTQLVLVRRDGRVQEKVYVDDATGLILRRELVDPDGGLHRVVAFESLTIDRAVTPVSAPGNAKDDAPEPRARPMRPATLAAGYHRVGTWARAGVVQSLYSDGVYELSVFEQRGRLQHRPAGAGTVDVDGSSAWHATWPGGELVIWQARGRVFTAVGEGPLADVLAAARSVPSPAKASMVDKLRRGVRGFFRSFS